ncbi:calcium-binding protein [Vibrio diazotrophicus]|nr:calcium-binding protein [Vibrio diazotrophicus]PNH93392.1 calcium-binding protein [Vibrio diazotrophicus]
MSRYLTMNKLSVGLLVCASVLSVNSFASEETDTRPMRMMPSFESVDTDGDGVISMSELDTYRSSMPMQMNQGSDSTTNAKQLNKRDSVSAFASFDKNKDGVITQEEFAAHSRYSNPGNGTGEMKMYKEEKTNRNKSKNDNGGGNSNNSNGKGNKNN